MKKILLIVLFLVLGASLVFAAQGNSSSAGQQGNNSPSDNKVIGGDRDEHGCLIAAGYSWNDSEQECVREWSHDSDRYQNSSGIGQQLSEQIRARKEEIKSGEYNGSLGQLLRVRELAQNLRELRVNDVPAKTDMNLIADIDSEGKTKLKATLRNGQEKEIKIMPDTASQRALERLRLKVCSPEKNCTIELKDVGNGATEKVQYEVQIERHSRILGIFSKKMQVRAEVDAETGETNVHKPWWAFIATEPAE